MALLTIQQKKLIPYQVKSVSATVTDVDMSKRIVCGFFNAANIFDSGHDVILEGAFNKSIAERGPDGPGIMKIKHLLEHEWDKMPGKIKTLKEATKQNITGTYFETKMVNTTLGNDTLINYQEKVYDNHSCGFQYVDGIFLTSSDADWERYLSKVVNKSDAIKAGHAYFWKELKLYEGTTTAFGENELTPYLGVKSMNKESLALKLNGRIALLRKQLSSGTQSDETMQGFEMQLLQLEQYISEIFTMEPTLKDTLKEGRNEDVIPVKRKSMFALSIK